MAFQPIKYDSGKIVKLKQAQSTTVARFDALDFSSGYAQRATAGTTHVQYIALESNVNGAGEYTEIMALPTCCAYFECDTAGNTSQGIVGTYIDLTDHDTLNQAASTTNVFAVSEIVGAVANKKVRGYFNQNIS